MRKFKMFIVASIIGGSLLVVSLYVWNAHLENARRQARANLPKPESVVASERYLALRPADGSAPDAELPPDLKADAAKYAAYERLQRRFEAELEKPQANVGPGPNVSDAPVYAPGYGEERFHLRPHPDSGKPGGVSDAERDAYWKEQRKEWLACIEAKYGAEWRFELHYKYLRKWRDIEFYTDEPAGEWPEKPWETVEAILPNLRPLVQEVREVSELGGPVVPLEYDHELTKCNLDLYSNARGWVSLLRADSLLHARHGNWTEVLEDLRAMLRLTTAVNDTPLMVTFMQTSAIACYRALRTVEDASLLKSPGEEEIRELSAVLSPLHDRSMLVQAIVGEQLWGNLAYEACYQRDWDKIPWEYRFSDDDKLLVRVPHGCPSYDSVALCNLFTCIWATPVGYLMLNAQDRAENEAALEASRLAALPYYKADKKLTGLTSRYGRFTSSAQGRIESLRHFGFMLQAAQEARADLTCLGLAIEHHRAAYGDYPANLEAVAWVFDGVLPLDPFSGESYRYRVQGEGGFLLYSIGPNQADDGGVVGRNLREGDIVWRAWRELSR